MASDLVNSYPYLFANLFYLVIFFIGLQFVSKGTRRLVLFAGLLNFPCFPFIIYLENAYWYPERIGGWMLGFEDAMCSFTVGAMVVLVLTPFFVYFQFRKITWKQIILRYLSFCSFTVILFFLSLLPTKANPMTALIISNVVVVSVLLAFRKDLWLLAFLGTITYSGAHLFLMKICFWLLPEFLRRWNTDAFWGYTFLNVPLGEVTWAFVYGAYWPIFIAYIFNLRVHFRPVSAVATN